jgi:hypothetical protein
VDGMPAHVDLKPFIAFQWKVGVTFTNQAYAVQVGLILRSLPSVWF